MRVTKKDSMRHYHNQKGDGKLFGLDLLDKEGTEIRAVCFNEAADKFYGVFEKDKVYIISRGSVRLARKGFSHITNDYSITLNQVFVVLFCSQNVPGTDSMGRVSTGTVLGSVIVMHSDSIRSDSTSSDWNPFPVTPLNLFLICSRTVPRTRFLWIFSFDFLLFL